MLKIFSRLVLKSYGWKLSGQIPTHINKAIIIQAPHTSYSDFYVGWHASNVLGVKFHFMIKKEAFNTPLGWLLKRCGGVPVDRKNPKRTVKQLVDLFKKSKKMYLVITPEGTRKYTNNWKKGFYTIAQAAGVPILMGYIDYKHKRCGLSDTVLYPQGIYEADFKIIKAFYTGKNAKYPENFNLTQAHP